MMRIVIVLEYFYNLAKPIGGAERQVAKLAKKMIEQGVEVTVVCGQWNWGESKKEIINGVPVHRLFTCWGMFNIRGLRKFGHYLYLLSLYMHLLFNRKVYDFIHCHSAMSSAFVVALAGKAFNKKTLARPMASGAKWGDISRMKNQQSLFGSRWMLGKFKDINTIIALNQDVVTELEDIGIERHKIFPMPNGVETDGVKLKTTYQTGAEIKITFVGRLHPQKGLEALISAFQKVTSNLPMLKLRLQLAGQGPLRDKLETQAQLLGVRQQVDFLGQLSDIFPILYDSDIFILPSRAEGMSNALLEGMVCGLPCIASNIPANAAIIKSGQNGLLVTVDDPDDIAKAIMRLVEDETLRERLGQSAVQTIRQHYSINSVAQKYITLYQNSLQNI